MTTIKTCSQDYYVIDHADENNVHLKKYLFIDTKKKRKIENMVEEIESKLGDNVWLGGQ